MKVSYKKLWKLLIDKDMKKRDYNDMHKPMGALKVAEDAIIVDTTNLSIDEVKEKVEKIILEKINK